MMCGQRHQPYFDIIGEELAARDASQCNFDIDRALGVPTFDARMCARLAQVCGERAGRAVDVREVLRLDVLASGHTDYQRKLSLYCFELERKLG